MSVCYMRACMCGRLTLLRVFCRRVLITLLTLRVVSVQKHRVVIPEGQLNRETARMSVAYFVHPDDDCVIQPIDGSNKSEPITALEYLNMRFKATY